MSLGRNLKRYIVLAIESGGGQISPDMQHELEDMCRSIDRLADRVEEQDRALHRLQLSVPHLYNSQIHEYERINYHD